MSKENSEKHVGDLIVAVEKLIEEAAREVNKTVVPYRKTVFYKFPLVFTLLATFGAVATLYGFERIIDDTPLLADHPVAILVTGLVVLGITGTLYKKLS